MLNDYCDQFRIQFAQRPPGMRRAPLVDLPLTLPELEEQFHGPAFAQQDQGGFHAQVFGRGIRHHKGPLSQFPSQRAYLPTFVDRFLSQPFSSLLDHFLGHTNHQQTHGQGVTLPQTDV